MRARDISAALTGTCRAGRRVVRRGVVFCEYSGPVVDAEYQDSIDREERHSRRHLGGNFLAGHPICSITCGKHSELKLRSRLGACVVLVGQFVKVSAPAGVPLQRVRRLSSSSWPQRARGFPDRRWRKRSVGSAPAPTHHLQNPCTRKVENASPQARLSASTTLIDFLHWECPTSRPSPSTTSLTNSHSLRLSSSLISVFRQLSHNDGRR